MKFVMSRMVLPDGVDQKVIYQREVAMTEDGEMDLYQTMRVCVVPTHKNNVIQKILLTQDDVVKMHHLMTHKCLDDLPDQYTHIGIHLDRKVGTDCITIAKIGSNHIPKKDYQYIINIEKDGEIIEHTVSRKQLENTIKFLDTIIKEMGQEISLQHILEHHIDYEGELSIDEIKGKYNQRKN